MKLEFTTKLKPEDIEANFRHLCGPNERHEVKSCNVNWEIKPILKQWGIWSFQQTVKSIDLVLEIFNEESIVATSEIPFKITDMDGYNIDFEIDKYDGIRDFVINKIEVDPLKKYIKAII